MPHIDLAVQLLVAAALLGSIAGWTWRGVRGGRLLASVFATFYGLVLVIMLGAHCVDILYALALGLPAMRGAPVTYDWRTYSLLLFGVLLLWQGVRCVRAAPGLARGAAGARRDVLRAGALVLALVLPLVPIHAFFGILIGGASALTMAMVAVGMRARAGAATPTAIGLTSAPPAAPTA